MELRPEVTTALVSVSTLFAPLGFLAGRLLGVGADARVRRGCDRDEGDRARLPAIALRDRDEPAADAAALAA